MNRAELFSQLPTSQEQAEELLRRLEAAGLAWHFDDSPATVETNGQRTFSDAECIFCSALVDRLNELWPNEGDAVNAGAWEAAACAEWVNPECVTDDERSNGPRR